MLFRVSSEVLRVISLADGFFQGFQGFGFRASVAPKP